MVNGSMFALSMILNGCWYIREEPSLSVMVCAFECRGLSNHQFICLLQKLCRDRTVQVPGNVHRSGAFVSDITCRTRIGVCLCTTGYAVRFKLTDKQEHLTATLHMVDIALTCGRILCRGTLALPMEQTFVDGVVVIHGCG